MVRSMVKERHFKCPVCIRSCYSLRGVAIHIVMKRDDVHAAWLAINWLPSGHMDIIDAKAIAPRIMETLQRISNSHS